MDISTFAHSLKAYMVMVSLGPPWRPCSMLGATLDGFPCVHLYPRQKMCPAAAVSCIIHDMSEFSSGCCLSVSTMCVPPLHTHTPHSQWLVAARQKVHTLPQALQIKTQKWTTVPHSCRIAIMCTRTHLMCNNQNDRAANPQRLLGERVCSSLKSSCSAACDRPSSLTLQQQKC